jgi:hypothetical protein
MHSEEQFNDTRLARASRLEPASRLDMHFVVRLLTNPQTGAQEVIGFLTFKNGIQESLFSGPPSEKTAYFTLRIEGLTSTVIANTGHVGVQLRPAGQKLNIYLHEQPNNDWGRPEGFSTGKLIATYYEEVAQLINMGPVAESTATFELIGGSEFTFQGKRYDFREQTPNGVTAVSYFNMTELDTGIASFPKAFSGAGVGYTIGVVRVHPTEPEPEQRLIGSFTDTIKQPSRTFKAQFTFSPGGGMVGSTYTADGQLAIANGVWRSMGNRQFALTFSFLGLDGASTFLRLKVRASIRLNDTFDEYEGHGQMDYYDRNGNIVHSINAPVAGTRMHVEPLADEPTAKRGGGGLEQSYPAMV